MSRKKSRLQLQKPKRRRVSWTAGNCTVTSAINNCATIKRKFEKTPVKELAKSNIRSQYRSPLYKTSPVVKKQKRSARSLFQTSGVSGRNDVWPDLEKLQTVSFSTKSCNKNKKVIEKDVFSKKSVFSDLPVVDFEVPKEDRSSVETEIAELIPVVVQNLADENRLDLVLLSFFKQVKDKTFPLHNVAFLLWCEVVRWFDCKTTTQMRYSDETKTFWKLGYRLFGERFVNFMSGPKSHGEVILNLSEFGRYLPEKSEINFAVPNPKVLRSFDPYNVGGERGPGLYMDIMRILGTNLEKKSACLTFDGKKIKQGLCNDSGDVDLLGFEKGQTLQQKKEHLFEDLRRDVIAIQKTLDELTINDTNIRLLPVAYKQNLQKLLLQKLKIISGSIDSVEEIKRRKEYCMSKLIAKGGEQDWRKSKYVYGISAVMAFLHDIDKYLTRARSVADAISKYLAFLNSAKFVDGDSVNLKTTGTYFEISEEVDGECDTRLIKQRTEQWQELRAKAKVTGSSLFEALGCGGLEKQKNHFDKVMCGVPEKGHSAEAKAAMEHGIRNEANGVATIVGEVMPVLEPNTVFCEEGCIAVNTQEGEVFMVVSPDGSLRTDRYLSTTSVAIEIKCPVRKVHSEIPP